MKLSKKRIKDRYRSLRSSIDLEDMFKFKPPEPSRRDDWRKFRNKFKIRSLKRLISFLKMNGLENSKELVVKYLSSLEKEMFHKGTVQACKKYKSIYGYIQRYCVSHKSEPIPFLKTRKDGIPNVIGYLSPLIKGSLNDRRNALTILQIFKLIETENKLIDTSSITKASPIIGETEIPNYPGAYFDHCIKVRPNDTELIQSIKKSYLDVLTDLFPVGSLGKRQETLRRFPDIYISGKRGPNGPSLSHSALDFVSLRDQDPELLHSIKSIAEMTNNRNLLEIIKQFEDEDDGIILETNEDKRFLNSRLSVKQEPGGKNRVFAIGDWFSQSALKSLHSYLFSFLKEQRGDGTMSHNNVAVISREWTKCSEEHLRPHSIDLTTATDRVPSVMQREILNKMFGKELSDHWYHLMVRRSFKEPYKDLFLQYKVGQPMGLLSSWAMLAVWHHVILRTIFKHLQRDLIDPKDDVENYLIIGDDVAVRGKDVFELYKYIVSVLCSVPISELKGFSPETYVEGLNPIRRNEDGSSYQGKHVSVEIAKRVFLDGREVTPVSPVAIQAGLELPCDFPSLLFELNIRGYDKLETADSGVELAKLNFNPASAISLASFPLACAPHFREKVTSWSKDDVLFKHAPWLWDNWDEECLDSFIKIIVKALRARLNGALGEIYPVVIQYMNYDCDSLEMRDSTQITSSGLNKLFTFVYRKCQDLITDYAGTFTNEKAKSFWTGQNPDPQEFKKYLGKLHVIFDIKIALEGQSQVIDEKRFSSKLLMELVKDYLATTKQLKSGS